MSTVTLISGKVLKIDNNKDNEGLLFRVNVEHGDLVVRDLSGRLLAAFGAGQWKTFDDGSLTFTETKGVSVEMTKVGPKLIPVIKLIREFTHKGLKDAKEMCDRVGDGTHVCIKQDIGREEAEMICRHLEFEGAAVRIVSPV